MDHLKDPFKKEHLKELAQANESVCVSLYMPTSHVESEFAQNPIRLKNLIRRARKLLKEGGHREQEIDAVLQPAQALLDNERYWLNMTAGFAAFLTPSNAEFYRLPLEFEELVVAGQRFHLKPLFPLFASNNLFYLLWLDQQDVRLYRGTHYTLDQMQATELPKDIMEAVLQYIEEEQMLQHHQGTQSSTAGGRYPGGRQDRIVHGQNRQGADILPPDTRIREFFHVINDGIRKELHDEKAPLILAGVAYYLPIYREVNEYQHLVEDLIVTVNAEQTNESKLHEKAWAVIEPLFEESQEGDLAQFQQRYNNGGGLASSDFKEIIPASVFSRVDKLFVPIGQHLWGHYDPDANAVELHDEERAGDDDLLDFAAVHTYLNGGTVHALQPDNMPVEGPLAATFRYPADVSAEEQ